MEVRNDKEFICKGRGEDRLEVRMEMRGCHVNSVLKRRGQRCEPP